MAGRAGAVGRSRSLLSSLGLAVVLVLLLPAPAWAQGSLTLEPATGPPATSITATVIGFEDCITVDGEPRALFLWDGDPAQQVADVPVVNGGAQAGFDVPAEATEGEHRVLVECAGFEGVTAAATFVVTTPEPVLITVPDVTGLTADDAEALLAEQGLVLATTEQSDLPIAEQDPPPNTQVPAGTVVAVSFAPTPTPPSSGTASDSVPWWLWAGGGLAVVAAGGIATRMIRRYRQRRWIRNHVRVVPGRAPPGQVEVETHVMEEVDR